VALSASGQLVPARREGFVWKVGTTSETGVGRPAMATAGDRAVVAYRTKDGALRHATLTETLGLTAGEIAPVSKNGPSLVTTGAAVRVAFTDASDGLLTATFAPGSGFSAPVKLTNDAAGSTSFAPPTTAAFGSVEGSVHAGTDQGVYYAPLPGVSEPIAGAGSKTDIAPVLVFDKAGRPVVFFARNVDSQLYVTVRTGAGTWSTPTFVAQNAFTDRSPSVARLGSGDLLVAWHGKDTQGVYYARAADTLTDWGKPGLVVQEAAPTASSPVVVAADAGAAEILFVRGGVATSARVDGAAVSVGSAFGTGLSEISGAYLAQ